MLEPECQLEQEMGEKSGEQHPSLAVTSDHMSTGASHPILNESLLGGLMGVRALEGGGGAFREVGFVCLCALPRGQKPQTNKRKEAHSHNKCRICSKTYYFSVRFLMSI